MKPQGSGDEDLFQIPMDVFVHQDIQVVILHLIPASDVDLAFFAIVKGITEFHDAGLAQTHHLILCRRSHDVYRRLFIGIDAQLHLQICRPFFQEIRQLKH
jgi:hypothetical protein